MDCSIARKVLRVVVVCAFSGGLFACGGGGGGGGGGDTPAPVAPAVKPNTAPTARAGTDVSVFKNERVQLSGATSSDADGDSLTYSWTQKSGPPVTLSNPTAVDPSFVAPTTSGTVVLALTVNDGKETSAAAPVSVTIQNRVPTAAAELAIDSTTNTLVTLVGSNSSDPDQDPLTYVWKQTQGPNVSIAALANGDAKFTAPGAPVVLEFTLTVSDGEMTSAVITIRVTIGWSNEDVPYADAGRSGEAPRRSDITLNGWGWDSLNRELTYAWRQVGGTPVTLSDPTSPTPSFKTPATESKLEFELVVSNGIVSSLPDKVTIDVHNFVPYVSATLAPSTVRTLDNIVATVDVQDWDKDPTTITYQWRRNGAVVASVTGATYPHAQQAKGDVIEATISASDGFETTSVVVSKTVQDTPPVYVATPPTQVNYGDTFAFALSASDADNDPVTNFRLLHGPAGMTVSSGGAVSWVARLPLFGQAMDVNYAIAATGNPLPYTGKVSVRDPQHKQVMRRTGVEIPTRDGALLTADLDNDGDVEILGAGNDSIYEYQHVGSKYEQTWVYPYYFRSNDGITVAAANVIGDARMEIFIASGSRIARLDAATREISAEYTVADNKICKKIEIANVDAAGGPELVCLVGAAGYYGAGHVLVLDPATMTKKWQTVDIGNYDTAIFGMTIANVDADAALEIVIGAGYVFDGVTHDSQWAYSGGFGSIIDAGDVTGDGIAEIVAASGSAVRIFDAVLKSPIGEIAGHSGGTGAVLVKNIEGTATAEILIGDAQSTNVTAYRYNAATNTGVQLFQIGVPPGSGVSAIAVGDVDNDGALEFIWGADIGSSGPDSLVVAGRNPTISIEWVNASPKQLTGNFVGGMLATVAPNQSRLMFATSRTDSGYDGARMIALDPTTGRQSLSSMVGTNWSGAFALDMVDYDNDGVDEAFFASSDTYTGYLAAYDFATDTELWKSPTDVGVAFAVAHGDFSSDGFADLVSISANYVNVFDVRNSNLIWRSVSLASGGGMDVAVANLEGDATPEIIAATRNRLIIYRRHASPAFIESKSIPIPSADLLDLLVADTDSDGTQEIYVLTGGYWAGNTIQKYSPSLDLLATFTISQPVNSLHLESLPTTRRNIIVSTGEQSYFTNYDRPMLRGIDPDTGAEIWRSPEIVAPVARNSLFYVDPNNDGKPQISFGAGANAYVTQ